MKWLKSILTVFFLSGSIANALNPVPGWYAGVMAGVSKPPAINFSVVHPVQAFSGDSVLTYSVLGQTGIQAGYRVNRFRVEGEFFFNQNPYKHLEINGVNIPNSGSTATTIQQLSIQSKTVPNPLTFKGYTNTYGLMLNGFYDFYIPEYTENFVPYAGVGIGYEQVQNNLTFLNNETVPPFNVRSQVFFTEIFNNFAGQAIAGMSYYLTNYTSFSLDFRYLSSTRTIEPDSDRNTFQTRPQLYSINLIFNAAFDHP
jgi:opacity protein-like surface antigen